MQILHTVWWCFFRQQMECSRTSVGHIVYLGRAWPIIWYSNSVTFLGVLADHFLRRTWCRGQDVEPVPHSKGSSKMLALRFPPWRQETSAMSQPPSHFIHTITLSRLHHFCHCSVFEMWLTQSLLLQSLSKGPESASVLCRGGARLWVTMRCGCHLKQKSIKC